MTALTRRRFTQLSLALAAAQRAAPAGAAPLTTGQWVHALTAFGTPRYAAGFHHYGYVDPDAPKGGTLRLGNPDRRASFDKFNPFTVKGVAPAALGLFVFEPLMAYSMDEPMSQYGLLAEQVWVAPDLGEVRFRLHALARFSDGSAVQAADVVHSWRTLTGPGAAPGIRLAYAVVADAQALDERTVAFRLKQKRLDAVFMLGDLSVFSRRWGGGKPLAEIVTEPPLATGPYTVAEYEMPSRLALRRNPAYWARELGVRRGHFNFDRIVYRLYGDDAVRREAFKAGEFDILKEYRASQFARAHQGPKWRDGRIVKATFPTDIGHMMQAFNFNLRRPQFQDIRVREAIMRAWDFENFNRYRTFKRANSMFSNTPFAAQGLPSPAELALLEPFRAELPASVFGPAFVAPRNDTGPHALRQNLKTAAALLAAAGWRVAADGVARNAAGQALEVEYLDPTGVGRFTAFERNLTQLGVRYRERQVDFALFRRRLESFDFDLVIIVEGRFTLPDAADLLNLYGSAAASEEGAGNYRGVKSRAVDALIDRIARAATLAELQTAARALDRVVMWNHWQIPQLYAHGEPCSYWNRFGQPAVMARYLSIDTASDGHSQPWPLWCWWDKAAETRAEVLARAPLAPQADTR